MMKLPIVLVFLMMCSNPCDTIKPSYCPTWNPLQTGCPLAKDVVQKLSASLEQEIAGQTVARRTIEKAIARNVRRHLPAMESSSVSSLLPDVAAGVSMVYSTVTNLTGYKEVYTKVSDVAGSVKDTVLGFPFSLESKLAQQEASSAGGIPFPLFMHFSGPTGVGKSLTADIVAKSVLADPPDPKSTELCGKMLVQMRIFGSHVPAEIEANKLELRAKVAEQLYHCPRSVLIFDEIQSVPEELLDSVLGIFDPTEGALYYNYSTAMLTRSPKVLVNTSQCIVIVISDLGSTKLPPFTDREQAKVIIQEEAHDRFLRSNKQQLLQNIVPFLSLSVDELAHVALLELKALERHFRVIYRGVWEGKLTWSRTVPLHIATQCFDDATCYEDGGRGIEKFIEQELAGQCEDVLLTHLSGSGKLSDSVSFDNIDVFLGGYHNDVLSVRMDQVFGVKEFREL